jgi:hypothetical protein
LNSITASFWAVIHRPLASSAPAACAEDTDDRNAADIRVIKVFTVRLRSCVAKGMSECLQEVVIAII